MKRTKETKHPKKTKRPTKTKQIKTVTYTKNEQTATEPPEAVLVPQVFSEDDQTLLNYAINNREMSTKSHEIETSVEPRISLFDKGKKLAQMKVYAHVLTRLSLVDDEMTRNIEAMHPDSLIKLHKTLLDKLKICHDQIFSEPVAEPTAPPLPPIVQQNNFIQNNDGEVQIPLNVSFTELAQKPESRKRTLALLDALLSEEGLKNPPKK